MSQPIWLQNLDTDTLRSKHYEQLPGATTESFADTLENFPDFLQSKYTPSDLEEITREVVDREHPNNFKARRALWGLYEGMLKTDYYRTEEIPHPEGGFVLTTYFGNIAVGIPSQLAEADPRAFHAILPSASEHTGEGLALPRPLSSKIWVEGRKRIFDEDQGAREITIMREGRYSALIKLDNGLRLRTSPVETFQRQLSACEDLRTLLDVWKEYRALVLNSTIGTIGALQVFNKNLLEEGGENEASKRDLLGMMFDLFHMIDTVEMRKTLRMPLRHAAEAIGLDENDWSAIFKPLDRANHRIRSALFPFLHPEIHEGRYKLKSMSWRNGQPQTLTSPSIEAAIKILTSSALRLANVPHLTIPYFLATEGDERAVLSQIARDNPNPTAFDEPYETSEQGTSQFLPCSSLAMANMAAASAQILTGCVGA